MVPTCMTESDTQTVLVTGTSSGLGREAAFGLARRGFHVFASMRDPDGRNANAADGFREVSSAEGLQIDVIELDICDAASIARAVDVVVDRRGRLDILINNAGIASVGWMEGFTDDAIRNLLETNALGVHRMIRAVAPIMRKQAGGLILNISSMGGRLVPPFMGAYAVSKFAMEAICEAYANELFPMGIDCVILEPGGYGTGLFDKMGAEDDPARLADYGDLAAVPQQLQEGFREYYGSDEAPPIQRFVDAVIACIDTPFGERPVRQAVGDDILFLAPVNAASEKAMAALLEQMELTQLLGRQN